MKKVSIFILYIISALAVWGGNDNTFDIKEASSTINSLKESQQEIVIQAKSANTSNQPQTLKLTKADRESANSTLNKTFASLDSVILVYNDIQKDATLQKEAEDLILYFIENYKKAIYKNYPTDLNIDIKTRSFLNVAETFEPKFEEFYNRAQDYLKKNNPGGGGGNPDPEIVNLNNRIELIEGRLDLLEGKSPTIPIWNWFSIVIGLLGLVAGCYALICLSKLNLRYKSRWKEINEKVEHFEKDINDIKTSDSKNTSPNSYAPPAKGQSKKQGRYKLPTTPPILPTVPEIPTTPTSPETLPPSETLSKPEITTPQKSTATNLFATTKADSPYPEFSKVSTDNTGDRQFMLILANPEAVEADYTIVPDMASDFMKSVISDRKTYLSNIFCEMTINSQNPSKIEVISKGVAKKVDGKWQVQNRMSIRLV